MKGKPINTNSNKRRNRHSSESANDFLGRKTLYNWRKNTANEIQFKLKSKRDFIDFFLRNEN